ncbi:MAG: aldo/keto reductase [Acetobacteraceae bacterium]
MQTRPLGRTGLLVSTLGFGCGAVGGLMVRAAPAERARAVAMAIDAGVTYFDTAPQYGNGLSETHLGEILKQLKAAVSLGTKVRIADADKADLAGAILRSMDASLGRLGREHVDLIQLHNPITEADAPGTISATRVLEEVVPAFQRLVAAGKTRFFGVTAIGETAAVLRVVDSGAMFTGQVSYNLLNPSAGRAMPAGLPGQDYQRLLARMAQAGMGAIGIRALAGGALAGEAVRHAVASPPPPPIGSAATYEADLANAEVMRTLVTEGFAASMAEAALRFVITGDGISTALIGIASVEQLAAALDAVAKGPLPAAALERLEGLWRDLAGRAR